MGVEPTYTFYGCQDANLVLIQFSDGPIIVKSISPKTKNPLDFHLTGFSLNLFLFRASELRQEKPVEATGLTGCPYDCYRFSRYRQHLTTP